jgi:uncharacterized SAM-binding protein YcdF (DUF218 family)
VYEVINALLEPFTLFYLLLLVALLNLWRKPRPPRRRLLLLTGAFAGLTGACCPLVAYLALGSLEWRYLPLEHRPADAQAIVVLSSGVLPPDGPRTQPELDHDSILRCQHAARLYHQGPPCKLIVSGGKVHPEEPGPAEARVMADFLVQLGVKEADLLIEDQSRSTYENAVQSTHLLKQSGIDKAVLVTDAVDMYRAMCCFRKQGAALTPSPCHFRATSFKCGVLDFIPNAGAARNWQRVAHEYLGTLWYWLHGRI